MERMELQAETEPGERTVAADQDTETSSSEFTGAKDPFGRFLKIAAVQEMVGLSRASVYRLMKASKNPFPRPIKVGDASLWIEREVIAWKKDYVSAFRAREADKAA